MRATSAPMQSSGSNTDLVSIPFPVGVRSEVLLRVSGLARGPLAWNILGYVTYLPIELTVLHLWATLNGL